MRPFTGLILVSLPLSLGGCGLPVEFTIASYAADAGLLWFTDKSSNDHLLSMVAGQDCAMWRVVKGRPICSDHKPGAENPYDIDYSAPHREVGEGGMVSVYTASRQGGRLLSEQEAAATLRASLSTATAAVMPAASPVVATGEPPAARYTAELPDTSSGPPAELAAPTGKPTAPTRPDRRRTKTAATDSPTRAVVRRPVPAASRSSPPPAIARAAVPSSSATPDVSRRSIAAGPSHSTAMAAVAQP